MENIFLLLGTNKGERVKNLQQATALVDEHIGRVIRSSTIYETAPWGNAGQESFLNRVLEINSPLQPGELLEKIILIEQKLGRERAGKWQPRTIDVDILFYGNEIVNEAELKIPHPFLHLRRFTLQPMNELAGGFIHPVFQKSIRQLLSECPDDLKVEKFYPGNEV